MIHISLLSGLITACTVVQAVVKANSQSNGKGQILTPWGSEIPERISMKLGIYNRVAGMPAHANPCGAVTTWVVWANTWKTCCGFLGIPFKKFFALFFGSRRACTRGPILTIYTSYDVFPPKDVFFGGLVHTAPHFGGKIPKTPILGAWIGILKFNVQNIKICILSGRTRDKFCTVTKTTKYSSWVVPTRIKQIQDGGRPPSWEIKNRKAAISWTVRPIFAKFGMMTYFGPQKGTGS